MKNLNGFTARKDSTKSLNAACRNKYSFLPKIVLLVGLSSSSVALAQFESERPLANVDGATELQRRTGDAIQAVCGGFASGNVPRSNANEEALFDRCREMVHTRNSQIGAQGTADDLGLNTDQLNSALQNVAGEEIAAAGSLATETVSNHSDIVSNRLAAILSRVGTLQVSSLNLGNNKSLILASTESETAESALAAEIPLGIYVNGNGGAIERSATDGEDGFDGGNAGITFGADYRVESNMILGAAIGYDTSDIDFTVNVDVDGGGLESSQVNVSGYALFLDGNRYLDVVAGIGFGTYDLERRIVIPDLDGDDNVNGFDGTAIADTDHNSRRISISGGYEWASGATTLAPFARFSALDLTIDGYTETGARELDLIVEKQNIDSLTISIGGRFVRTISTGNAIVLPQFSAEWVHELGDDERQIVSIYEHDPARNELTLVTDAPDSNYFVLGLGVSAVLANGMQLFIDAKSLAGLNDIDVAATVAAGFRYEF